MFNTVQNKSVEWGVLPWHWYFSRAIPKSLHVCLPLAVFGLMGKPNNQSTPTTTYPVINLSSTLSHTYNPQFLSLPLAIFLY